MGRKPIARKAMTNAERQRRWYNRQKEIKRGLFTSRKEEYCTPPAILDLVAEVLEKIDVDPCGHTNSFVPATTIFLKSDGSNSLDQETDWLGSVFLNPPYGKDISLWLQKLSIQYKSGITTSAIALIPARTDTAWWKILSNHPFCLIWGRVKFLGLGAPSCAPFLSAVFYLGSNKDRFIDVFSRIGDIYTKVKSIPQSHL
jgi:hypothetical protein